MDNRGRSRAKGVAKFCSGNLSLQGSEQQGYNSTLVIWSATDKMLKSCKTTTVLFIDCLKFAG